MVTKDELKERSRELEVGPINVQRDYVFGWILFGIYAVSDLKEILILKGGNCLRKAYFEHTRFSGDLDFSTQRPIDPAFLKEELNKACMAAGEAAGVRFDTADTRVEEGWSADKDQRVYKARLYFEDFLGKREGVLISIRLDVTELDRIHLPLVKRNLIHAYSDARSCSVEMTCVSLEEALGTKLKCLLQRRHIADLYDFAYGIFVRHDLDVDRAQVAEVFLKKTIFGASPKAAVSILTGLPLEKLEEAWSRFIICPKNSILVFGEVLADFRAFLAELFEGYPSRLSEMAFFPSDLRNPIMEAGSSLTVLKVSYDGYPRVIEPYSLAFKRRKDGVAREYLFAYDRTGGKSGSVGIKTFVASGFRSIENTEEKFEPREEVVIAKAGEDPEKLYFGSESPRYKKPFTLGRPRVGKAGGVSYVVQCPYCSKKFTRRTRNLALRPHKDRFGNRCFGKRGVFFG
ncbi:MAG: nucleotidyl transferase AbiEii/AbiGii toxin family protein [Fimbriimonas sp.]